MGYPIGTFSGRLGKKRQRGCQKVFLTLKQSFFMKIGVLLVILCQNNQPKRGPSYSCFTLGAQNFFLDQVRGASLTLRCQIALEGICSIWSYGFTHNIGFGRLEKTVLYLSPRLCQFFRRTQCSSPSKLEVPL